MRTQYDYDTNINNKISIVEGALLFFTGFLGLSALSNKLTNMVGIPYIIEIYFLPFMLFYYKRVSTVLHKRSNLSFFNKVAYYYLLFIVFISTIFGMVNTGEIYNVVTLIRPFIYMVLLAYYYANKQFKINIYKIYIISFGALLGELFNKFFIMGGISNIDHINVQALSLFILIPFIKNNKKLALISTIFGIMMGIITLYRRIFLTAIIVVITGLIYHVSKKKSYKVPIYVSLFSLLGGLIYNNFEKILLIFIKLLKLDDVNNYYLSGSYRLIEKFKITDSASDNVRRSVLNEIFTKFEEKLIPRGPIGKSLGIHYFGAYTDTTNVFLYDVFGSVVSWIIVIIVGHKAIKSFTKVIIKRITDEEYVLSALMVPIFLISMFLDGTFLVHANISILAGYAMHGWFQSTKK